MSETTSEETSPYAFSWGAAFVLAVIATVCCLVFAFAWEAIAQATGDF